MPVVRRLVLASMLALAGALPAAAAGAIHLRQTGSLATGAPAAPAGLSCPEPTGCVTLAGTGAVVFDPTHPAPATPAALGLPSAEPTDLSRVACPAADECVAIAATAGGSQVATFDPGAVGGSVRLSPGPAIAPAQLVCPTVDECVAAGGGAAGSPSAGAVASFDPRAGGASIVDGPAGAAPYRALACPSADQCTAVSGDGETTFDPGRPGGGAGSTSVIDPGATLTAVDCSGAQRCVGVDDQGRGVAFDPSAAGSAAPVSIDVEPLTAISCAAGVSCVAVDASGFAVSVSASGPLRPLGSRELAAGALSSVSCRSDGACTALGPGQTELSFAAGPGAPGPSTGAVGVVRASTVSGLACPARSRCVALRGTETGAVQQLDFDPSVPSAATGVALALTGAPQAVSCPSASRCVADDDAGHALAFGPGVASGRAIAVPASAGPRSLACASPRQCTVVGGSAQRTFDPGSGATISASTLDTAAPLTAVDCPAATQCTAGDADGNVTTFNAAAPQATPRRVAALPAVAALSCPTVQRCVAVGGSGVVAFDPTARRVAPADPVDPDGTLAAIDCPLPSRCYAADGSGRELELDLRRLAVPVPISRTGAAAVAGISCPAPGRCVVADALGQVLVGSEHLAPAPAPGSRPTVHGRLRTGGRLVARPGRWLATSRVRYRYRWRRCARSCRPIHGATRRVYRVRGADRAHRLQVLVTASDRAGRTRARSDQYGPVRHGPVRRRVRRR